jgi:hypothetical protein
MHIIVAARMAIYANRSPNAVAEPIGFVLRELEIVDVFLSLHVVCLIDLAESPDGVGRVPPGERHHF